MHRFLLLLCVVAVASAEIFPPNKLLHRQKKVRHPKTKSTQDVSYRLPTNVTPIHYDISISLEEDIFVTNTFSGSSAITIVVQNATSTISFHAKNLNIKDIQLWSRANLINVSWSEIDPITDIVTVLSETVLVENGEYILAIAYDGILSTTEMSGFYKSSYTENGQVHYLGSTDFEPTNARKVFPSFDEPAFKATFAFIFTVPINLYVIFNTAVSRIEYVEANRLIFVFETTPVMSTYLIAFVVSEYTCTEALGGGTVSQVCSKPETAHLRGLALDATPDILNVMQDYTNFSYSYSSLRKLSQASIPDYEAGAMENWGLVIYRETYLLWDANESSNRYKQYVVTIIAHELAHQWFGDLVTLDWWSDVFLNEGFATYFEYYAPDEFQPDWQLTKQFVVEQLQGALESDSYDWVLPLSSYVESPDDIYDRFDAISYNKGGSILRMVRYFLGLDNFKAGLYNYLARNQFSIGTPTGLWQSFEQDFQQLPPPQTLPATISEVMYNWTYANGYPVLTVTPNGNDVVISQKQFLYYGSSDNKYYVPITYTLSSESTWDTTTRAWLTPNEDLRLPGVLAGSDWIVLNNEQIGYYRVDYDTTLWQKISSALSTPNFGGISTINRAQIADDLINFALANKRTFASVLEFLSFLENETEYYPWYSSFNGFSYLLARTGSADLLASLKGLILQRLARLYASVPFEVEKPDDFVYTMKQDLALSWACSLGDENCVRNSRERFDYFRNNNIRPSRNLRSIIYCNALRHSDNASRDFDFLWSRYLATIVPSEQETILATLGCIADEEILKQYLQKAIVQGGGVRKQDIYTVFSSAYSSSPNGINAVFDFVTTNYKQFISYFGGTDELSWLFYAVTNRFTNEQQVDKLLAFIQNPEVDYEVRLYAAQLLDIVEENLRVTAQLEDDLRNYFTTKN